MITWCTTLLPIGNPHSVAVDIGLASNLILVRLKVRDFDAVAVVTNVSIDFIFVVNILYFLTFVFQFLVVIFEVCNRFVDVTNVVIKTVKIIYFFLL